MSRLHAQLRSLERRRPKCWRAHQLFPRFAHLPPIPGRENVTFTAARLICVCLIARLVYQPHGTVIAPKRNLLHPFTILPARTQIPKSALTWLTDCPRFAESRSRNEMSDAARWITGASIPVDGGWKL